MGLCRDDRLRGSVVMTDLETLTRWQINGLCVGLEILRFASSLRMTVFFWGGGYLDDSLGGILGGRFGRNIRRIVLRNQDDNFGVISGIKFGR